MCENDAMVDAWFQALVEKSHIVRPHSSAVSRLAYRAGQMSGVIRELAATVPGAREWLIEHMPGEG